MNFKNKIQIQKNEDKTFNLSIKLNDEGLIVKILNRSELEQLYMDIEKNLTELSE